MSFQLWTIFHLISLIPLTFFLVNIWKMKAEETESVKFFSFFLISLISLTIVNFGEINSPDKIISEIFSRLVFVCAGLIVFFFVMSAEYFSKVPKIYEKLFYGIPLILSIFFSFFSPFSSTLKPYGWQGDWVDPLARYSLLASINLVVIYSVVNLLFLRNSMGKNEISMANILTFSMSQELRNRMNYFIISAVLALFSGSLGYVLIQIFGIPNVVPLVLNLSFLPAYFSFKKSKS